MLRLNAARSRSLFGVLILKLAPNHAAQKLHAATAHTLFAGLFARTFESKHLSWPPWGGNLSSSSAPGSCADAAPPAASRRHRTRPAPEAPWSSHARRLSASAASARFASSSQRSWRLPSSLLQLPELLPHLRHGGLRSCRSVHEFLHTAPCNWRPRSAQLGAPRSGRTHLPSSPMATKMACPNEANLSMQDGCHGHSSNRLHAAKRRSRASLPYKSCMCNVNDFNFDNSSGPKAVNLHSRSNCLCNCFTARCNCDEQAGSAATATS